LKYLLQATTNLVDWAAVSTNQLISNRVEIVDEPPPQSRARFYRAIQLP